MTPENVIKKIAEAANEVGSAAGVGGLETAGQILSFLAAHPEHITAFMTDELDCVECGMLRPEMGCLSWHGMDGKIHWPVELRDTKAN